MYESRIVIPVSRCSDPLCRRCHAILPEASVPGCSIGTKELDIFIRMRSQGSSVDEAGQVFVDKGMAPDYPETIHRRLKKYCQRLAAIFPEGGILLSDYAASLAGLAEYNNSSIVLATHTVSYEHNCNPVLFSRKNILAFPKNIPGQAISNNSHSRGPP